MATARSYITAIAGLRAVAVVSIVLYHINAAWIPGGFVGVDIFFVISGFVVAHSVADSTHDGFGSYVAAFYKRRFQRILPAAWLFIAVMILIDVLFIPATQETRFFEATGAASAVGFSNIVLYLTNGDYFSSSSELNPFTHTWSLAVEEQYYFLFPFFSYAIFIARKNTFRTFALLAFLAMFALSLALSFWLTRHNPTFAFYMIPARFWELGCGFLLRVLLTEQRSATLTAWPRPFRDLLALVAVGGLAVAFIHTDPTRFPFPGAILPCLATVLLLGHVWAHPGHWLDRALSLRLPVWLGNISYSLYLWHWGVIVLLRWTIGIDTIRLQLGAAVVMMILAQLSYTYVEMAFHNRRHRAQPPSARLFATYGLIGAGVMALCAIGIPAKPAFGLASADDQRVWDPYAKPPMPAGCDAAKHKQALGSGTLFTFPATCTAANAPHLFVLGDSHAGAYQRSAWTLAAQGTWRVELVTLGGCRPIVISRVPDIAGCDRFLTLALAHLRATARPGDVVFLPGLQTTRYRSADGAPLAPRPLDPAAIAISRQRLAAIAALGVGVVVEGAKPLVSIAPFRCADWFNRGNPACRSTPDDTPQDRWHRTEVANAGIRAVADGQQGVTLWYPDSILCPNHACLESMGGKSLFFDMDHITAFANDLLLPSLTKAVEHAASKRPAPL